MAATRTRPDLDGRVVPVKKITGGRRQHDFDSSIMQLQIVGGGTVLTDDIDVDGRAVTSSAPRPTLVQKSGTERGGVAAGGGSCL